MLARCFKNLNVSDILDMSLNFNHTDGQNTASFFVARIFMGGGGGREGGAYLVKNWDQKINLVMIGHASAEDTRLLGGSGDMLPPENV